MAFNFDELLEKGKGAAENVLQNRKEIQEVLSDLKASLGKFLELDIEFYESTEYKDDNSHPFVKIANQFSPREATGFKILKVAHLESETEKSLFKLKRSDEVYPVTLAMEKNHIVSDNQKEFAASVGEAVSNSQLHLALKSFKREVEKKLEEKTKTSPKSD